MAMLEEVNIGNGEELAGMVGKLRTDDDCSEMVEGVWRWVDIRWYGEEGWAGRRTMDSFSMKYVYLQELEDILEECECDQC